MPRYCAKCEAPTHNNLKHCHFHRLAARVASAKYRKNKLKRNECAWSGCKKKPERARTFCKGHLTDHRYMMKQYRDKPKQDES